MAREIPGPFHLYAVVYVKMNSLLGTKSVLVNENDAC